MDNNVEKAIERVKKLLEITTEKGATEAEALNAALKAQKIMAEYNFTVADTQTADNSSQSIVEEIVQCGKGNKWKYSLESIVARNFCCKTYTINKDKIVFYGYEKDAKIASKVFEYLFCTGNKLAIRQYNEYRKTYYNANGVKNTYLIGFCKGIDEVLGKQCTALLLVTPKEVEENYEEKSKGFGSPVNTALRYSRNKDLYDAGYTDGKHTANGRYLEN